MKGEARSEDDHLTPSIVHMPLCICIFFCNMILISSIVLQYRH